MIGQKFGLDYLIPIAVEKIQKDIFIEADFYEGDLLENILKIDKIPVFFNILDFLRGGNRA